MASAIDKPPVLTSHDVVAAAARTPGDENRAYRHARSAGNRYCRLAIGRATRLVRFFAASDKDYEATIRFGVATDTHDIGGREISRMDAVPAPEHLVRALQSLTGEYPQPPPAFSAKIGGRRAYELLRAQRARRCPRACRRPRGTR